MTHKKQLEDQCLRLGISLSQVSIDTLTDPARLPSGEFSAQVFRFKEMLSRYGISALDDCTDDELEEEMPLIVNLKFCGRAGFYDGWQKDMPNVPDDCVPFASDIYYFFFLKPNADVASDPLVFGIDHEETDSEPEDFFEYSTGMLLSILEPVG